MTARHQITKLTEAEGKQEQKSRMTIVGLNGPGEKRQAIFEVYFLIGIKIKN